MKIRDSFVERFGEDNADAMELAASEHRDGSGIGERKGSDPFRWAVLTCIGFQCMEHGCNGLTCDVSEVKSWIVEHHLKSFRDHDGDVDFLGLFCGVYSFLAEVT